MKQLSVRELCSEEIIGIYDNHLVFDFPVRERKPLEQILHLNKEGDYPCYGLFEGKSLRGYAFFCAADDVDIILLDYLSIISDKRGSGYGGKFLRLLQTSITGFTGCVLEVEDDEDAKDAEELKIRQRRIAFYYANSVKMTNLRASVKKVKYKVMFLPIAKISEDEEILYSLETIYQTLYGGDMYEKNIDYIIIES